MELCELETYQVLYTLHGVELTLLVLIGLLLIPCILFTNCATILVIWKHENVKHPINQLFLCLSVANCGVACLSIPLFVCLILVFRPTTHCASIHVYKFMYFFWCHLCGYLIFYNALDRYLHIRSRGRFYLRTPHFVVAITACTLFSVAAPIAYDRLSNSDHHNVVYVLVFVVDGTLFFAIIVLYFLLFRVVRGHLSTNQAWRGRQTRDSTTTVPARPKYARALTKTLTLILLSLVVSYIPYAVLSMVYNVPSSSGVRITLPRSALIGFHFSSLCVFSNSFMTALIFLYRHRQAKRIVRKMLCLKNRIGPNMFDATTLRRQETSRYSTEQT